jgi:3-carboxy-cis,cis-muconate cycloisomerase
LAAELQLGFLLMPWHTQRDRVAEVATTLGLCTGTLGKIARDISLHMQTEIAEVLEPAGGPWRFLDDAAQAQPRECRVVLSAATRVPGLVSTMLSAMVRRTSAVLAIGTQNGRRCRKSSA